MVQLQQLKVVQRVSRDYLNTNPTSLELQRIMATIMECETLK